jgi:SAM-dependent methyltransferase
LKPQSPPEVEKSFFLQVFDEQIRRIENQIDTTTHRDEIFEKLRYLGLGNFGLMMLSMPNPDYPKISALLPRMASVEAQMLWTGISGVPLLEQTLNFAESVACHFTRHTGQPLHNRTILDFGCGYGRIARLMYYFTNSDNFYAVDPWDRSIETCNRDGLTKNFLLSDWLPSELPTGSRKFSLIYSFSVFTHLSERATRTCLNTLLRHLEPDGLLAITIRPVEHWQGKPDKALRHNTHGFAFEPHQREPVDGDITYGESSMTLEWISTQFPGAEIVGIDRSLNDTHQIYVFLRHR